MKLLSFGEVLFDIFPDGEYLGGAPLNLAAHAALQGADAYIWSEVGEDRLGEKAIAEIKKLGVKTDCLGKTKEHETGKCIVTLGSNAVPSYDLAGNCAYDYIEYPNFKETDRFDVLAFGTLAMREGRNLNVIRKIIDAGICGEVYTDLNIRKPFASGENIRFCLENATVVKISDEELPIVCDEVFGRVFTPGEAVFELKSKYPGIKIIIITCGEKGAIAFDCEKNELYSRKAENVVPVSTVGAGDSFGATFLVRYFKTGDIQSSLEAASKVSAFVVSQTGAVPEGIKEFLKTL